MTQTHKEALIELRDKVWAGGISVIGASSFSALNGARGVYVDHQASDAMRAYNGSLDAAKALHEAVLPGWFPGISQNIHFGDWYAWVQTKTLHHDARDQDPARAWLLAILEALIAKAGDGE
jgi:hypothetical protein